MGGEGLRGWGGVGGEGLRGWGGEGWEGGTSGRVQKESTSNSGADVSELGHQ